MDKDKKPQTELSREAHIELDYETYDSFEKEKKQEQNKQVDVNQNNTHNEPTPNLSNKKPTKEDK